MSVKRTLAVLAALSALGTLGALGALATQDGAFAQEAAEGADAGAVRLTRVTLATGGLAQVEGTMMAPALVMRLSLERAHVADVLRTLLVTGPAPVVSVDLRAAEPAGERSATGRLLAGDLADPVTVLHALIGEEVELSGGAHQLAGRLLAFDPVVVPGAETTPETPAVRVAVAGADGRVAYATFASLDRLAIGGAALARRMQDVIPALAESVDETRREVSVRLAREAAAGFSFVIPTTVWRPSYRALLDEAGAVELQGWATLENTTGLDWERVELRLAVGTPVAYRQDVYAPLRTMRPQAPFAVGRTAQGDPVDAAPAAMSLGRAFAGAASAGEAADAAAPAPSSEAPKQAVAPALLADAAAAVGRAATVFSVAGRIDLAAGRTLTVPFLSRAQEVERIAYLDLAASDAAPMDALSVRFDADATVPGGLVAVYDEGAYVGDARFAGADGGATSVLPFALSSDLDANVTQQATRELARASMREGTLHLTRDLVTVTTLALEGRAPVRLLADVTRAPSARLAVRADDGASAQLQPLDAHRSRIDAALPAGPSRIVLTETQPLVESYRITDLPTPIIEAVLALGGGVDEETRATLRRVQAVASEIAALDRRIATVEADAADLRQAVEIDRENLEAIDVSTPEGAQVRRRIVERTDAIGAALEELRRLRQRRLAAEAALAQL